MPVNFAEIKRRRIEKGLTLREAAERAGYKGKHGRVWWSDVETGLGKTGQPLDLRISTLEAVSFVLECSVEDLLITQKRRMPSGSPGSKARP